MCSWGVGGWVGILSNKAFILEMLPQRQPQDPGYTSEILPQTPVSCNWSKARSCRRALPCAQAVSNGQGEPRCSQRCHCRCWIRPLLPACSLLPKETSRQRGSPGFAVLLPAQELPTSACSLCQKGTKAGCSLLTLQEGGARQEPLLISSRVKIKWLDFVLMEKKKKASWKA